MNKHEKINYVEFPSRDLNVTKAFFAAALNWSFEDYGDSYVAFSGAGLDGGFYQSDQVCSTDSGSVLVVLYSDDLQATQKKIEVAGGVIIKPVFDFPGGQRFHFADPNGNEYAVWKAL